MDWQLKLKRSSQLTLFSLRDVTKALLRVLPMAFETGMTEDDLDQPKEMYQRARNYIKCNPQCKLRDEDVQREGPRPTRQFKPPDHIITKVLVPRLQNTEVLQSPSEGSHGKGMLGPKPSKKMHELWSNKPLC